MGRDEQKETLCFSLLHSKLTLRKAKQGKTGGATLVGSASVDS